MKSQEKRAKNSAFTLIELLITTSVMMILLAVGAVNYFRYLNKEKLYLFAGEVEAIINDARVKARTGYLGDEDLGFCDQVEAVELEMTNTNGYLLLTEKLNCVGVSPDEIELKQYQAEENFTADNLFKIAFTPSGAVSLEQNSSAVGTVSFVISNGTSDVSFAIVQGGLLETTYD
jgi:type II secretory pathway pseudopilin PulG